MAPRANGIPGKYSRLTTALMPGEDETEYHYWRAHDLARALLYLDRLAEALNAADAGLVVLPKREGYAMTYSPVYTNVAESLFDAKVQALLELGRGTEAAVALRTGFDHCPGSEYLSLNLDFVTRVELPPDPDVPS